MKIEFNHPFIESVMRQVGDKIAQRVGQAGIMANVSSVVRGQPRKYSGQFAYEIHLACQVEDDNSVFKIASSTDATQDLANAVEVAWREDVVHIIDRTVGDMFRLVND